MAKVTFIPGSGTLAAYLSGEIDHHAAQSLRKEIDAQIDDRLPELLTLDFSGVTFMDSSGVGLILGRGRHNGALGGRLTVQNPPRAVRAAPSTRALPARRWRRFWCSWIPPCLSWLISRPLYPRP